MKVTAIGEAQNPDPQDMMWSIFWIIAGLLKILQRVRSPSNILSHLETLNYSHLVVQLL